MQLLINPAISHDHVAMNTKRLADVRFDMAKASKAAAQNNVNKKGTTAGDGPGASGLSHGSIATRKATKLKMLIEG